jgi:hypothetical protein
VNCAELRQRIVDPSSASTGGHAPVVEHLHECAECRSLARAFGEVEKVFASAGRAIPPEELDQKIRQRLSRPARGLLASLPDRRILGAAVLVTAVAAAILIRARTSETARTPAGSAATPGSAPPPERPRADAPPPDILAVRSTPISIGGTPLSEGEKAQALALLPRDFLEYFSSLGELDPFFPERLPAPPAGLIRPPRSPEEIAQRLAAWEEAGPSGRRLWLDLDNACRAADTVTRETAEERWGAITGFSSGEKAGLRRLASRLAEIDGRRRKRLEAEIRAVAVLPASERRTRWRALPFAGSLTGQELESGEKLLLLF